MVSPGPAGRTTGLIMQGFDAGKLLESFFGSHLRMDCLSLCEKTSFSTNTGKTTKTV
jgi:hypothetical protein